MRRTLGEFLHDILWAIKKRLYSYPEKDIKEYETAIAVTRILKRRSRRMSKFLKRHLSKAEWRDMQNEIDQVKKKWKKQNSQSLT